MDFCTSSPRHSLAQTIEVSFSLYFSLLLPKPSKGFRPRKAKSFRRENSLSNNQQKAESRKLCFELIVAHLYKTLALHKTFVSGKPCCHNVGNHTPHGEEIQKWIFWWSVRKQYIRVHAYARPGEIAEHYTRCSEWQREEK